MVTVPTVETGVESTATITILSGVVFSFLSACRTCIVVIPGPVRERGGTYPETTTVTFPSVFRGSKLGECSEPTLTPKEMATCVTVTEAVAGDENVVALLGFSVPPLVPGTAVATITEEGAM